VTRFHSSWLEMLAQASLSLKSTKDDEAIAYANYLTAILQALEDEPLQALLRLKIMLGNNPEDEKLQAAVKVLEK